MISGTMRVMITMLIVIAIDRRVERLLSRAA